MGQPVGAEEEAGEGTKGADDALLGFGQSEQDFTSFPPIIVEQLLFAIG